MKTKERVFLTTVEMMDGTKMERESQFITEAVVGLCVYTFDMKENRLYPWHQVKMLYRREKL